MECDKVTEKMSDYIEGLMTPEEESFIRTHLSSCKKCEAAYSDLEKTVGHIKNLEEVEPPAWLTRKVMTRIKEEASKEGIWKRLFYPLHIKLPLEALATVLVAVTALYIFKSTDQETKIAEVRPGEIKEQQFQSKDTPGQKGSETLETKKKSVPGETLNKSLPSRTVPSALPPSDIASEPGHDNLSPVIIQKKSAGENIPQAAPAPAPPQLETNDASGGKVERSAESGAADKRKAAGGMKYAAPFQKEELKQRPESPAPIAGQAKASSMEGRISREVVTLNLYVTNFNQAIYGIRKHLAELGGRIVEAETDRNKMVLTVEIDSKHIDRFFDTLRTIGELKEKEPPAGMAEGTVRIKIEMVKKPYR